MNENYEKLKERVLDSLERTDLKRIQETLRSLKDPTVVCGVGGSSVVSTFAMKVLRKKNHILCDTIYPKEFVARDLDLYRNVLLCSFRGKHLGVELGVHSPLHAYLLSKNQVDLAEPLCYEAYPEHSFISLSATLIPMSILLLYALDLDLNVIYDILEQKMIEVPSFPLSNFEILGSYDTLSATKFLDSTFTESGMGMVVCHDVYDFCHGRSVLGQTIPTHMIHFFMGSELDELYTTELPKYYSSVFTFHRMYEDPLVNDYYFTYMAMLLCREIALQKDIDLSRGKSSSLMKKLYPFRGEI